MSRRLISILSSALIVPILMVPALGGGKSLLVGTWKLDLARFTATNPPRSVTVAFADVRGGEYKMTVNIVDHGGGRPYGVVTFKPDGTATPTDGNADYSVVSMTMPSRRVLVMGGGYKGHPANTRVWSLSDDGEHMIETVVWHGHDGTPHTRVDYWSRMK